MKTIIVELTDEQREALLPLLMDMPADGAVFAQVYVDGLRVKQFDSSTAAAVRQAIGTPPQFGGHNSAFEAHRMAAQKMAEGRTYARAARDVLVERARQVEAEGWTPEHDDEHADGSLCMAAVCYAEWDHYEHPRGAPHDDLVPVNWPWARKWWKPRDRRRNLVRAAALLLAEIERMDRQAHNAELRGDGQAQLDRRPA